MDKQQWNQYAARMQEMLRLKTMPVAIKWYEDARQVPEQAIWPVRDLKKHMAFCQATALTRFEGKTVAMGAGDHWCWNPLIGFGAVACEPGSEAFRKIVPMLGINDPRKAEAFFAAFPRLPLHKFEAVVSAPLESCTFCPDVALFYCTPYQLNMMLLAIKRMTGEHLSSEFDGIDSCIYATVVPYFTGNYRITLPDPGDIERAQAADDEVILSVPMNRLEELYEGVSTNHKLGYGTRRLSMVYDFPRPPFYNELFAMWGLEQGENWQKKP